LVFDRSFGDLAHDYSFDYGQFRGRDHSSNRWINILESLVDNFADSALAHFCWSLGRIFVFDVGVETREGSFGNCSTG